MKHEEMSLMREQAEAVQRMQDYIEGHMHEVISLEGLAKAAGYSAAYACRMFKRLVGCNAFAYIQGRRLSRAAMQLRDSKDRILDVAMAVAFDSHEGFTRAFSDRFGISPQRYRQEKPPIRLFLPRSARSLYYYQTEEVQLMETNTVFVQVIERPDRKLILQRGKKATHYFEYCEELGCDVWGILESIAGALYEPIGIWLPKTMQKSGTSVYAQGVEVPADYKGAVPEGMEILDLPSCKMMVFNSEPYEENDQNMEQAIQSVWDVMKTYKPESFGWHWADDVAPRFQLMPLGARGYIEGRPVKPIV